MAFGFSGPLPRRTWPIARAVDWLTQTEHSHFGVPRRRNARLPRSGSRQDFGRTAERLTDRPNSGEFGYRARQTYRAGGNGMAAGQSWQYVRRTQFPGRRSPQKSSVWAIEKRLPVVYHSLRRPRPGVRSLLARLDRHRVVRVVGTTERQRGSPNRDPTECSCAACRERKFAAAACRCYGSHLFWPAGRAPTLARRLPRHKPTRPWQPSQSSASQSPSRWTRSRSRSRLAFRCRQ